MNAIFSNFFQNQHTNPNFGGGFKESYTEIFECIQRRTLKVVEGLEGMSCEEGLRTLGLSSLKKSMLRGDLMAL